MSGSSGIQASFVGSRLRPALTIRDENLQRSESRKSPEKNGSITGKCPSPTLKRVRPRGLAIPALQCPGLNAQSAAVEQPMEVNVEGFHYAVSCKKGLREFMEDTHKTIVNLLGDSKQAFFGVFDGHSGRQAAAFAAENIGQNIVDAMLRMGDEREALQEKWHFSLTLAPLFVKDLENPHFSNSGAKVELM